MPITRILVPLLIACLVWTPLAAGSAFAADEPPAEAALIDHQLACTDGVCSLRLDLGEDPPKWLPAAGFALNVLEENLHVLPDGAGISVSDGLVLDLPIGNLKLADARIDLVMGEDGSVESFYGTAALPKPSLGIFSRANVDRPIATSIGFDSGAKLPAISAALDPERKYLFFDLAAGTELAASLDEESDASLWLSIPEGQRATVVIDPQERFAYVDGNVTLRYSGSAAFLATLLDPTESLDLFRGELPIRHEATVHVTGVVADQLADSRLEFAGRYAVDGGRIAELLKLNGEPLALEGGIVISDEGLLGTGIVRSTVLPETVWDSAVQAQVFVPFSGNISDAYAALNTRVEIPIANVTADGYARLDGALDMIADGSFDSPWRRADADAVVVADEGGIDSDGEIAADAAEIAAIDAGEVQRNRWARAWDATTQGAQSSLELAKKPAGTAADWVKQTTDSGVDAAAGGLEWSIDFASSTWCSTTGMCQTGEMGYDAASATAMK